MKKLISLGILLLLSACAELDVISTSKEAENPNFYQHWVHSYEEQGGQKSPNIFRPAGSREFPASRFRMEFGFDTNGQCNYKFLSPTDRHQMRNCVFTKIGNKVYLYDDQGKILNHILFTLQSASKDKMVMSYGIKAPAKAKKDAKPQ